jgi:hypothetical protein
LKAIVIFTDEGIFLRRFLKKGFKHVFACVESNGEWICVDYYDRFQVFTHMGPVETDLASIYREMGYTVVETETGAKPVKFPFMVRDCVSMVKSVISVSNLAITPYGLYRRIKK